MQESITDIIFPIAEEFAQERGSSMNGDPNATLYGKESAIDSIALVSLIVSVEDAIEDTYGTRITIADERAFAQERNPFASVANLAAYVEQLVKEGTQK